VTHNSLVASQRAHISLIDRRHLRPHRVLHRALCQPNYCAGRREIRSPLDSVKPYQRPGFAALKEARSAVAKASVNNRLLERDGLLVKGFEATGRSSRLLCAQFLASWARKFG
jgi:hypothetical protein